MTDQTYSADLSEWVKRLLGDYWDNANLYAGLDIILALDNTPLFTNNPELNHRDQIEQLSNAEIDTLLAGKPSPAAALAFQEATELKWREQTIKARDARINYKRQSITDPLD